MTKSCSWSQMFVSSMNRIWQIFLQHYQLCIIIGICLIQINYFIVFQPTIFGPTAIDMGPFFERHSNPNFAPNDFFTNASTEPNPRHIFGYTIIFLNNFLNVSWYQTFYGLFTLFSLTIPILFFLILSQILSTGLTSKKRGLIAQILLGFSICFFIFMKDYTNVAFSIGLWEPLRFDPSPQTMSLFLGLSAILIFLHDKHLLALLLFIGSSLVHPAIGLFCVAFLVTITFPFTKTWKQYFIPVLATIMSGLFVQILFLTKNPISSQEFINHYVMENHHFHYQVSSLGSYSADVPWLLSFGIIFFGIVFFILLGIYLRDRFLLLLGIFASMTYCSAVLIQFLGTEVFSIKILATIGPIRYTMFGLWLLLLLSIYVVVRLIPKRIFTHIQLSTQVNLQQRRIIAAMIIASAFLVCVTTIDDPYQKYKLENKLFSDWIETNTKPEDVFVVYPGDQPYVLNLVYNRSVFFGNGFPFLEKYFSEHDKRKALIYGLEHEKLEGFKGMPWERTTQFYRGLAPSDFKYAAEHYQLDYAIIEAAHVEAFYNYEPIFADHRRAIYSIKEFDKDNFNETNQ